MKKSIYLVLLSLASVACSSKSIDGEYNRIDQTVFEQENGMSSGLVISNDGQQITLKNAWGDVALTGVQKDQDHIVQHNNQDAFILKNDGGVINLIDVDNPSQVYKFEKD